MNTRGNRKTIYTGVITVGEIMKVEDDCPWPQIATVILRKKTRAGSITVSDQLCCKAIVIKTA